MKTKFALVKVAEGPWVWIGDMKAPVLVVSHPDVELLIHLSHETIPNGNAQVLALHGQSQYAVEPARWAKVRVPSGERSLLCHFKC